MQHAFVLINLACLATGIYTLALLVGRHQSHGGDAERIRLRFFAADSYLMIVAALFAYLFINVSNGETLQRVFAGFVMLGMAALELTLPDLVRLESSEGALRLPPSESRWYRVGAALTCAQAPLVWSFPGPFAIVFIGLAFVPFSVTVAYSIARSFRLADGKRPPRRYLAGYLAICLLAAVEIIVINSAFRPDAYLPMSLPLAYALASVQFLRMKPTAAPERPSVPDGLSPEVTERFQLTARETEMTLNILQGLSNKEIARKLNISENTVRNHIYNLYQKLGIQKRMDLLNLLRNPQDTTRGRGAGT